MLLSELVERLQESLDTNGDGTVWIARQPSWPLAGEVANVWDPMDGPEDDESYEQCDWSGTRVLWIASTDALETRDASPYAPVRAFGEEYQS